LYPERRWRRHLERRLSRLSSFGRGRHVVSFDVGNVIIPRILLLESMDCTVECHRTAVDRTCSRCLRPAVEHKVFDTIIRSACILRDGLSLGLGVRDGRRVPASTSSCCSQLSRCQRARLRFGRTEPMIGGLYQPVLQCQHQPVHRERADVRNRRASKTLVKAVSHLLRLSALEMRPLLRGLARPIGVGRRQPGGGTPGGACALARLHVMLRPK
jgi:hypothetical protein